MKSIKKGPTEANTFLLFSPQKFIHQIVANKVVFFSNSKNDEVPKNKEENLTPQNTKSTLNFFLILSTADLRTINFRHKI